MLNFPSNLPPHYIMSAISCLCSCAFCTLKSLCLFRFSVTNNISSLCLFWLLLIVHFPTAALWRSRHTRYLCSGTMVPAVLLFFLIIPSIFSFLMNQCLQRTSQRQDETEFRSKTSPKGIRIPMMTSRSECQAAFLIPPLTYLHCANNSDNTNLNCLHQLNVQVSTAWMPISYLNSFRILGWRKPDPGSMSLLTAFFKTTFQFKTFPWIKNWPLYQSINVMSTNTDFSSALVLTDVKERNKIYHLWCLLHSFCF